MAAPSPMGPSGPLFPRLASPDSAPALRVGDGTLSYEALARACAAHGRALAAAGVRPGDRVALWTQRHLEVPVALVGNALYGAVSVPLDPSLGHRELRHILGDAAPVAALAADVHGVADRTPGLSVLPIRIDTGGRAAAPERAATDEPLLVLYTSGTTGPPKGAVITAQNAASNLDGLAQVWSWDARDTVVHALPLFHVHGLVLGLFGSLRAGGCLHWVPRFSVEGVCAALGDGGTCLFAVPTMYHRLADAADVDPGVAEALRGARLLVSGSAALPVREHQRIERATGRAVVERYGLTETLINCAVRPESPEPGRVGPPVPGVDLRLVDDARRELDVADDTTLGEVAVRGPSLFTGYLNRPESNASARDAEGWFYTGDLATRGPGGSLRLVGRRATDLIQTGGFKVGAGEVESALLEDSSVAEAAVLGAPDADLGERIVAFVVLREGASPPTPGSLAQGVADALSPHKRPREVRVVPSLPRNAMGKVQKSRLRATLEDA